MTGILNRATCMLGKQMMNKARILIVENEPAASIRLRTSLEQMGYAVAGSAAWGDEAARLAAETQPDLVLLGSGDGGFAAAQEVLIGGAVGIGWPKTRAPLAMCRVDRLDSAELASAIEEALARRRTELMLPLHLRENEVRLHAVFEAASDAMFLIDRAGHFLDVNSAGCFLTGCTRAVILAADESLLRLETDLPRTGPLGEQPELASRMRLVRPDGEFRWVERTQATVQANGEDCTLLVLCAASAPGRHETRDLLTGLPNRALFNDRLTHALNRISRHREQSGRFAVLYLDLDRFKVINDSLGHSAGDQLLVTTARLLRGCIRDLDTVARLGGDEFVVLLEEVGDTDGALLVAGRIQETIRTRLSLRNRPVFLSASIGIVMVNEGYSTPEEILQDADIAMYCAKTQGKACSAVFEPEMRRTAVTRLELESDMPAAVERGEFELHYQPIINFTDCKTTGFEALLRWRHPAYGLLQPGQFLPIAEETGFIVRIGAWVLREACRQMVLWRARYPGAAAMTISVNISGGQVILPDFAAQVEEILRETGLEPTALRLEITETVLLEGAEGTLKTIRRLRDLGIRLEIDDFGTGYSALSYIQRFPVDTIKIDRSFIESIGAPESNLEFIRSILKFAAGLNLNIIAEGIETEAQMRVLKDLMCPYGQGYFISRPLRAEDIPVMFQ